MAGHGRRVYSVGSALPLLALERAGRPARAEELDPRRGALRRRRLGGAARERARRVLAALGPVVRAIAQDERSQLRNRELATERVLEQVVRAARPGVPRRPTLPSLRARERRLEEKRQLAERKRLRRAPEE